MIFSMENCIKKYFITTYGCQMNLHESEKIAGILCSMGYSPANAETDADIIVFNTCCIRENAEKRAEGNIGALKQRKKTNKNSLFYLTLGELCDIIYAMKLCRNTFWRILKCIIKFRRI